MKSDEIVVSTTTDHDELESEDKFLQEDIEAAHEMAEKLIEFGSKVTLGRVLFASLVIVMLLLGVFATWYWVIPRDAVDVETQYYHRGGGHVTLVKLDNLGSREITDVSINVQMMNMDGELIGSAGWSGSSIPAHMSVSGDDLELIVQGHTVWAEYDLIITLDWTDGSDAPHSERFEHRVGEHTSEWFIDSADRDYWLL